jgi:hypothetical protein
MKTKILLTLLGFSIFIIVDGKSLFHSFSSSAGGRSENQGVNIVVKGPLKEKVLILCQPKTGCSLATPATPILPSLSSNQESRINEFQMRGKMSKSDPRKPIWLKDIPKSQQGSKGNQIFRKIKESRKNLISEENEPSTPVVSELRRNQASVRLVKSCYFEKINKCTNLEWIKFWNSGMVGSNSIPQSAGSSKIPMTEKESPKEHMPKSSELTKDQIGKSNLIQISSKTERELVNLHSKVPSELTRNQIHRTKICYFDKFERCSREDWYKFLKGNRELSKSQLIGSGQTPKTEEESIDLPSKSISELTRERERKLQLIGSELTKDQKATVKICNFEKFERCTRKEWYEFLKGNNGLNWQLSKSQLI